MSKNQESKQNQPIHYEITVKGHLDCQWAGWFEGVTLTQEANSITRLTCSPADQAALHALLTKVRDLGLPLLSLFCIDPDSITASLE